MTGREKDENGKWQYAEKGCPGAIWGGNNFGTPASKYCYNDDRFPWWQTCCTWKWGPYSNPITNIDKEGFSCLPKSGGYY